jgi:hypothetical protein
LALSLSCENAAKAAATTPSQVVGFGSTAVNGSGVVTSVSFTLSGLTAAPTASLAGIDFSAAALTCNSGFTICSSSVTFLPLTAGLRVDALVLKNSSGAVLAAAYLYGTGTGPLARLMPARIKTLSGNGAWAYVDSTTSTNASFRNPQSLAADVSGNIYVADSVNQVIRKVAASNGAVSTVVGNGTAARTGDGGAALSASLNTPTGVAVDSAGNLFIADHGNSVIRRVDAVSGVITTVAGGATTATGADGYGDGLAATGAILSGPSNVAVDYAGNLYISDSFHNLVRKVTAATGVISVVAGGGSSAGTDGYGDGLAATSASLNNPTGIAVDASGNVYISDTGHSLVRLVTASTGIISAFAGTGSYGYQGDGAAATAASLGSPAGLRLDAAGNLFIADFAFHVVRVVNASTAIISTLAGNGTAGYTGDNGTAPQASLNNPSDVAFDGSGNLLICDYSNNVIRQIAFAPPTLTFPATNIAVTSALSTLTLANFGNAALNLASITLSSAFAQKPSGGTDCAGATVLAGGASCQIALAFIPAAAGSITGTLTIADNSLNRASATQAVTLAGTGISGTPAASLNATSLTFASQAVGTSSAAQTVTLNNSGTAALNISNLSLGGNNTTDFTFTTTCQSVLAMSASCTITVTFKPTLSGTRTASITVVDSAQSASQTLTLTGTGTGGATPSLSAAQLQFGSQVVSTSSASQTLTLANGGTSALSIYGVVLSGTNASDFWLMATTCGSTLAASASCTITVQFIPTAIGARSAALLVNNSSGNSPLSAALNGAGTTPVVFVAPATTFPAVFRPSNGTWYVMQNDGASSPIIQAWGASGDVPVPGDYDGDGIIDIAVWRPSNGTWYVRPSTHPGTFVAYAWGASGDVPVPGDYDGDGKTDYAVWRPSSGTWYILPSSHPGTFIGVAWGGSGDTPVPGDYDGDGKTDYAVWRSTNGTWYIVPSTHPGTFVGVAWGGSGDVPVAGDYDGDGKTDYAVFRPSNGTWYVVPSSKPSPFVATNWGANGDTPVPGDFDGDGKTDYAVFRPSNGTWYIIPSAHPASPLILNWGTNGDVPVNKAP